jgi:hypothetical protein
MARLDRAISLREMENDTRGLADGPVKPSHDEGAIDTPTECQAA